jgi:hypothetical protein
MTAVYRDLDSHLDSSGTIVWAVKFPSGSGGQEDTDDDLQSRRRALVVAENLGQLVCLTASLFGEDDHLRKARQSSRCAGR